ncbi:hypothetical protein EV589_1065 [Mycobacterium sp. BK558]|nr:hypothetical protein EV589_1065 [Mycobacterium sp. BK558]
MAGRRDSSPFAAVALRRTGGIDCDERKSARALIAAIVAGGLAVSAVLYPTPGEVPFIGSLDAPSADHASGLPGRVESISTNYAAAFEEVGLQQLLQVVNIFRENPHAMSVDTLVTLTNTYGLRNVVQVLAAVGVTGVVSRSPSEIFGGAVGGGGGGSLTALPGTLPEWALLLEFLLHRLPAQFLDSLPAVISRMLPALDPVGIQSVMTSLTAVAALSPPIPVPAPAPAPSAVPMPVDAPGPAPSTVATVAPPAPSEILPSPTTTVETPTASVTYAPPAPTPTEVPTSSEPEPSLSPTEANEPSNIPSDEPTRDQGDLGTDPSLSHVDSTENSIDSGGTHDIGEEAGSGTSPHTQSAGDAGSNDSSTDAGNSSSPSDSTGG